MSDIELLPAKPYYNSLDYGFTVMAVSAYLSFPKEPSKRRQFMAAFFGEFIGGFGDAPLVSDAVKEALTLDAAARLLLPYGGFANIGAEKGRGALYQEALKNRDKALYMGLALRLVKGGSCRTLEDAYQVEAISCFVDGRNARARECERWWGQCRPSAHLCAAFSHLAAPNIGEPRPIELQRETAATALYNPYRLHQFLELAKEYQTFMQSHRLPSRQETMAAAGMNRIPEGFALPEYYLTFPAPRVTF